MSDGSEFQVCGAATENARHVNSVRVLAAGCEKRPVRSTVSCCLRSACDVYGLASAVVRLQLKGSTIDVNSELNPLPKV